MIPARGRVAARPCEPTARTGRFLRPVGCMGQERLGFTSSSSASHSREGVRKRGRMPPTATRDFSAAALDELLDALRARTSTHPDNPGLIASWPGGREDRMAAACTVLINQGYPLFKVSIPTATP